MDFLRDSVSELATAVQLGDLSARELVTHALGRIEALDGRVNAFVALSADQALADAADLDERQARGEDVGVLAGIPIGVKDLEDAAGLPTTNGSLAVPGTDRAAVDSKLVARLKQAGAIVIGKTNTPEHGWTAQTFNPRFGTTRNPWDPARAPGGSSGGSAAAIAAGMVPLATGSDGGGSIRIPSSVCGLSGFKPSLGRVPAADTSPPGWPLLSTRGTMAWRVADLAASLDAVIGPDPADLRSLPIPESSWVRAVADPHVPLRIAWSPTLGYAEVDLEILDACTRAVGILEEMGAEIVEVGDVFEKDPAIPWIFLVSGYLQRTFAEVRHTATWDQVTPELRAQMEAFEEVSLLDFVRAGDAAHTLNLRLVELFADARLLATPTVAGQTPHLRGPGHRERCREHELGELHLPVQHDLLSGGHGLRGPYPGRAVRSACSSSDRNTPTSRCCEPWPPSRPRSTSPTGRTSLP